jgi:hypothetical protein
LARSQYACNKGIKTNIKHYEKIIFEFYQLKVESEGQWGGTLESVYGALAFDKATGWSRWLMLNEQQPSLWCNNDFLTPLPDPSE